MRGARINVLLWCPSHGSERVKRVWAAKSHWPVSDGWRCMLYCGCSRYEPLNSSERGQLFQKWKLEEETLLKPYPRRYPDVELPLTLPSRMSN